MNHQINLLHLKYFCDAVTHNSISEAAKINFVTQSAVSQAVNKLELSLNVKILSHTRQKFQLTEEGKIVFEQARYVFKAIQNIQDKINQNKQTITGSLKFVSTNSLGMSFIPSIYRRMQIDFPHIDIHYRLGNLSFIRNALRQGDAEFAIVVYDKDFEQFSKQVLKKGSFHLYQSKTASQHLIENGILVDYLGGTHVDSLSEHLQSLQHTFQIQAELTSWEVVARFVEMDIGVGFLPDYILAYNRYPTLQIFPQKLPLFEYEICAIHNKDHQLSRAASTFLNQFSILK